MNPVASTAALNSLRNQFGMQGAVLTALYPQYAYGHFLEDRKVAL